MWSITADRERKALLRNLIHTTHTFSRRRLKRRRRGHVRIVRSLDFRVAEDRVKAGLIPVKDIVRDNFERLERIFREGKASPAFRLVYRTRQAAQRLQNSELLILAARPSQGKTALA